MKTHKNLQVWQSSMELVKRIYELSGKFPAEEKFGLTNQMRRAAVSIPSNIAEGAGRNGEKEFIRFLYVALGSLSELETQVEIARMLGYYKTENNVDELISKIIVMLTSLIKKLSIKIP